MAKLPAFQFYPGDWMKDSALRRCSLAARGVWIDMLCLMSECGDRGVLATGGVAWTVEEIAAVISGDTGAILLCIEELLLKGVAHQRGDKAIFSKRMVRDQQKRAQGKKRVEVFRERNAISNGSCNAPVTPKEDEDEDEEGSGVDLEKKVPVVEFAIRGLTKAEEICSFYPVQSGIRPAIIHCEKALDRLRRGERGGPVMSESDAAVFLMSRVKAYAKSPRGKGSHPWAPSTFFSESHYIDDESTWSLYQRDEKPRSKEATVGTMQGEAKQQCWNCKREYEFVKNRPASMFCSEKCAAEDKEKLANAKRGRGARA